MQLRATFHSSLLIAIGLLLFGPACCGEAGQISMHEASVLVTANDKAAGSVSKSNAGTATGLNILFIGANVSGSGVAGTATAGATIQSVSVSAKANANSSDALVGTGFAAAKTESDVFHNNDDYAPFDLFEIDAKFDISGDLSAIIGGRGWAQAEIEFQFRVDGELLYDEERILDSANGNSGSLPENGSIEVTYKVFNGETVTLELFATAFARAFTGFRANASADGTADYDSTFRWAGITEIRDALGNPVSLDSWTLTDEEGNDWLSPAGSQDPNPVPEPSSLALFACGLLVLGFAALRRRRFAAAQAT